MNLDDIHSNNKKTCLHCGVQITPYNDSGWEEFTDDGKTTQPVCIDCCNDEGIMKKEEIIRFH